jgi:hypothetical protein
MLNEVSNSQDEAFASNPQAPISLAFPVFVEDMLTDLADGQRLLRLSYGKRVLYIAREQEICRYQWIGAEDQDELPIQSGHLRPELSNICAYAVHELMAVLSQLFASPPERNERADQEGLEADE